MDHNPDQEPLLQEMLSLSFMAYLGTADPDRVQRIDDKLPGCFESVLADSALDPYLPANAWSLVWGPEVAKLPGAIETDNLMYAVEKSTGSVDQLAIVIRGTNPYGLLDWLEEDFEIHNMLSWRNVTGSSVCEGSAKSPSMSPARISAGTQKALDMLIGLENDSQQSVKDYLKGWCQDNQGDTPRKVYVTGHSLGGLMTPVFSLWLAQELWSDGADGMPAPCAGVQLEPISFAGPTPGNEAYARCVEQELGKFGGGLQRIQNPLDLVPYAWARDTVKIVPYLYGPDIKADDLAWEIVDWALRATDDHEYAQIVPDAKPLCRKELSGAKRKKKPSLLAEGAWQHHYSYLYGLEMESLGTKTGLCPAGGTSSGEKLDWCLKDLAEIFCWKPE